MEITTPSPEFRSGYVSIVGRPNVGKSTLLNHILGEKLAITSKKPQTTRNRILGVHNTPQAQIILLDTPGIHHSHRELNKFMVQAALSTLAEVDAVLFMVEAFASGSKHFHPEDLLVREKLEPIKAPILLLINKIDLIKKEELLPIIDDFNRDHRFSEIIPISALKGDGMDRVVQAVEKLLPYGPRYFPEDMITDLPERFLASEIIREKIFKLTHQEIPYATAVSVDKFEEREGKGIIYIAATVHVEHDSQKGMVIGQGGKMLKKIGSYARETLEEWLESRVYLELFVRTDRNWTRDDRILRRLGYR